MSLVLRSAEARDVGQIHKFIADLAEYEKLRHEMIATEQQLQETLFGPTPYAHVVIAEWNSQAAGFALYFYNYSTFLAKPGLYLEDLFVLPEFRNNKIGKALLCHLAKIAVDNNCGRFEWSVLDWNQPAIDFYRAMGAEGMDEWTVQRVSGDALIKLAAQSVS
ncbi:MAG: GNAT family N-acetyltransferase [Kangiellaceae bacterium]|jgi:GNAT superfamily N-acetyltransferase|nr:GNAT family N-acetyltransferase [Kangiellaceae bacterium]